MGLTGAKVGIPWQNRTSGGKMFIKYIRRALNANVIYVDIVGPGIDK